MPTAYILAQVFIFFLYIYFTLISFKKIYFTLHTKNTHTQDLKDKNVPIETH